MPIVACTVTAALGTTTQNFLSRPGLFAWLYFLEVNVPTQRASFINSSLSKMHAITISKRSGVAVHFVELHRLHMRNLTTAGLSQPRLATYSFSSPVIADSEMPRLSNTWTQSIFDSLNSEKDPVSRCVFRHVQAVPRYAPPPTYGPTMSYFIATGVCDGKIRSTRGLGCSGVSRHLTDTEILQISIDSQI